jgi:parvulin-like peptidyl-prolyl isomerase
LSKEVDMRRGIGILTGWIAVGVLAALAGPLHAQTPAAQARPVAVVNGEPIAAAELENLLKKEPPQAVMLTGEQKAEMRKTALDMLIDDVLMRQFLRKNVQPVSPAAVQHELTELQQALAKQKPPRTLQDFLKETAQTEQQLRADVAARLQWKAYVTARVPEQAIRAYYDQNKVFFDKVFVRASHILLRLPPRSANQDKQAYEREKQAIRAKLVALRQDIVAGKIDFAQAAKTYSDCPSKASGGDVGHFPYKFAVQEPFARAAFAMKVGDLSDVVETEFGYHLIKVTDRTKGEPSTYETIKDLVRDVYVQEHELYQGIIAEQRKTARIEIAAP